MPAAAFKRLHNQKYRNRTDDHRQYDGNRQGYKENLRQLVREGQKPQQEEQNNLSQTGHSVKKRNQRFFASDIAVSQQYTHKINRQKCIAADGLR